MALLPNGHFAGFRVFGRRCSKGVHKFQPRYSHVAPEYLLQNRKMNFKEMHLSELYEKRYECDVCVRCGIVVQKEKSNDRR